MPLYYALFQRVFIPGKSADSWARIESRFPETEQKCFKDEKSEFASREIIEQIKIIFQFFFGEKCCDQMRGSVQRVP